MKRNKNETISSTMGMFLALASTVLALSILSALLLNLVLPLSASWLMQGHYRICQAALRPVACESRVTIHQ